MKYIVEECAKQHNISLDDSCILNVQVQEVHDANNPDQSFNSETDGVNNEQSHQNKFERMQNKIDIFGG